VDTTNTANPSPIRDTAAQDRVIAPAPVWRRRAPALLAGVLVLAAVSPTLPTPAP
jgi:hypothetical protein